MAPFAEIPTRTVVLGMIRRDGTLVAGDLYDVAASIGMSDQQVRLCLRRLVGERTLSQEGRGRKAIFRARRDARLRILPEIEFLDLALRRDRGEQPWDGRWRLVAFGVPEQERPARDRLRERLVELGTAALQGGVYVSPNDLSAHLLPRIEELGIARHVTHLTTGDLDVGRVTEPTAIAAHLWDLDGVGSGWRDFQVDLERRVATAGRNSGTHETAVATVIEVVLAFTHCMLADPILPVELLPQPWAGTHARERLATAWPLLTAGIDAAAELSLVAPLQALLRTAG